MLPTPLAELLEFQFLRRVRLVFLRDVVEVTAHGTL